MAISSSDTQTSPPPTAAVTTTTTTKATTTAAQIEVESVKCHSCGFTEECTPAYISRVRDRYQGRWICGLCVEAVKDEVLRSDRLISTEEALNRHVSFCNKFRSSSPVVSQTEHPIFVMGRILRRSLDSPRPLRSNSSGALPGVGEVGRSSLVRSGSCFSALSG